MSCLDKIKNITIIALSSIKDNIEICNLINMHNALTQLGCCNKIGEKCRFCDISYGQMCIIWHSPILSRWRVPFKWKGQMESTIVIIRSFQKKESLGFIETLQKSYLVRWVCLFKEYFTGSDNANNFTWFECHDKCMRNCPVDTNSCLYSKVMKNISKSTGKSTGFKQK